MNLRPPGFQPGALPLSYLNGGLRPKGAELGLEASGGFGGRSATLPQLEGAVLKDLHLAD